MTMHDKRSLRSLERLMGWVTAVWLLTCPAPRAVAAPVTPPGYAFPKDRALVKLERQLPRGWRLIRRAKAFVIRGGPPIWVVHANRINVDVGFYKRQHARWLRTKGQTPSTQVSFTFRYEPRWSAARIARVRTHNQALRARIARIARSIKGRWKRGADAYDRKTYALRRQLKTLPYQTGRYAVFPAREHGIEDRYTLVFPAAAARAGFQLRTRLLNFWKPYQAK